MKGRRNIPENIWQRIDRRNPDECWEWQATRDVDGYGRMFVGGKNLSAHRLAWMLTYGPIPVGLHVCHRCDNPPCCNPAHLFLGTGAENHADKVAKGRQARGETARSTLTEGQVRQIRALAAAGLPQRRIARQFGITQPNVGYICRRETWRHVA